MSGPRARRGTLTPPGPRSAPKVGPTRAARNGLVWGLVWFKRGRAHARGEERRQLARSQQFRMQFDWVNFQQYLQTLQFQRYGRAARHSVGGIACDIHGKLTGRDSCATTRSTAGSAAGSTAGSAATGAGGGLAQRPGTVDTVAANDLPKSHRDRSRDHAQTHNLTTTSNTNFPAPTSRKVTTQPTRFVP